MSIPLSGPDDNLAQFHSSPPHILTGEEIFQLVLDRCVEFGANPERCTVILGLVKLAYAQGRVDSLKDYIEDKWPGGIQSTGTQKPAGS